MRSRSSSLESLICALCLSTVAVNALPTFHLWQRDSSPEIVARAHVPDPRVLNLETVVIEVSVTDSFQSQDIPPSFVRPSRRRSKGLDGLPSRLVDQADELDFGPDTSTFSPDFHEVGDEQPDQFWEVMQALKAASQDTYNAMFDGVNGFSRLRKILPFTKATKGRLGRRTK
ncbi:hypothetical protein DACRYDRAFT_17415 [Dacryopinax primogenitus]|uniref:Uncharacterized protein n=1 Tax=Dacryopinax primogenitus (strain DJM 731) TaxID=1858805 RepID=M5FT74_DACPD|nr:uncharacterized protein DACRYDRAFT_17415 [Dacryopinax primogenitus]EJT99203.1 hypothetical protein DACRYDRAFT_17415 [Dacryopinax primogenitus]